MDSMPPTLSPEHEWRWTESPQLWMVNCPEDDTWHVAAMFGDADEPRLLWMSPAEALEFSESLKWCADCILTGGEKTLGECPFNLEEFGEFETPAS